VEVAEGEAVSAPVLTTCSRCGREIRWPPGMPRLCWPCGHEPEAEPDTRPVLTVLDGGKAEPEPDAGEVAL
jgi:hypothetical protein